MKFCMEIAEEQVAAGKPVHRVTAMFCHADGRLYKEKEECRLTGVVGSELALYVAGYRSISINDARSENMHATALRTCPALLS